MGIFDDYYGGYENLALYTDENGDVDFDAAYGTTLDETFNNRIDEVVREHLRASGRLDESDDDSEYEGLSDLEDCSELESDCSVESWRGDMALLLACRKVSNRKCTQSQYWCWSSTAAAVFRSLSMQ